MASEFKTMMAALERGQVRDAQLLSAADLASAFDARLIGVMACDHPPSLYFEAGSLDYDPIEEERKRLQAELVEEEKRFRMALSGSKAPHDWRSAVDWPTDFLRTESRAADLVIAFPRARGTEGDIEIGALIVSAGRPVLLLHERGLKLPAKVLVAWKETRESRRAVRDALPFLKRAASVHVLEIVEGEGSVKAARRNVADVVAWLATHDVPAIAETTPSSDNVADQIDAAARDMRADLIVAGGYGHSRLGEWIFGGMTRHLIMQRGCSVLLSH